MQNITAPAPKQCRLLGATVTGLGLVVAVEANLHRDSYAVLETAVGAARRVLLADLRRGDVTRPAEPQPYVTCTGRVDYGVWDAVHTLVSGVALPAPTVVLAAAA